MEKVSAFYLSMSRGKGAAAVEILRFGSARRPSAFFPWKDHHLKDIRKNSADYTATSDALISRIGRYYIWIRISLRKGLRKADYPGDADLFYAIIRDRLESVGMARQCRRRRIFFPPPGTILISCISDRAIRLFRSWTVSM
jgi:hypothetical protein